MFDHTIASRGDGEGRGWGSLGMAAAGHLALLAGLLCSSYLVIEQVSILSPPVSYVIPLAPPMSPRPPAVATEPARHGTGGGASLPKLGTPRAHPPAAPPLPAVPLTDMLAQATDAAPMDDSILDSIGSGTGGDASGSPDGDALVRGVDPTGSPDGGEGGPLPLVTGVEPPVLLTKVVPEYPERARVMRQSGRVFVKAVVSPRGEVVDVEVVSSTLPIFEEAALAAVRQWKYRPATLRGRPVAVHFTVVVSFTLR